MDFEWYIVFVVGYNSGGGCNIGWIFYYIVDLVGEWVVVDDVGFYYLVGCFIYYILCIMLLFFLCWWVLVVGCDGCSGIGGFFVLVCILGLFGFVFVLWLGCMMLVSGGFFYLFG